MMALDLSQNFNIRTIWCQDNQLKTLYISHITNFSVLCCESNNISCIHMNQAHVERAIGHLSWSKNDTAAWSLECDN